MTEKNVFNTAIDLFLNIWNINCNYCLNRFRWTKALVEKEH